MLSKLPNAWRRVASTRTHHACLAAIPCAAMMLTLACPGSAAAQTFVMPEECTTATGDEGDDPVVLISKGSGEETFTNFRLLRFVNPVSWGIFISPYRADTYNIFTTYTPFLTSDRLLEIDNNYPSLVVPLPAPGVTGGRTAKIFGTFTLTVMNKAGAQPVANAFVDFIPAFVGSSPYTMQATGQGRITLNCVQQVHGGYDITVYGADHTYLYDGSFATDTDVQNTRADGSQ